MFDVEDSFLPKTATPLAKAMDVLEERLFALPVQMISKDPETVDAGLLDHLAWEESVDVWDETWTPEVKRNVIAVAAEVHRYKGTPFAIQKALQAFDVRMELLEWWQEAPTGQPGTFTVTVFNGASLSGSGDVVVNIALMRALISVVERAAPVSRGFYLRVQEDVLSTFYVSPALSEVTIDRAEIIMGMP
jgi:phage tail P2-like protein